MTSVKTCSLARRDVVRGAAALALSAALGPMVVNRAQADESAAVPNVLSEQFATGGAWNGEQYVGQSMVHHLRVYEGGQPIVFLPGKGLSAQIFTSTPDGRPGWSTIFANAGYDTYCVDTHNLAVAGLDVSKFGTDEQPSLSVWGASKVWPTWGLGDVPGEPYPTTQYPVEFVDQLYASFSAQVSEGGAAGGKRGAATDGAAGGGKRGGAAAGQEEGEGASDGVSGAVVGDADPAEDAAVAPAAAGGKASMFSADEAELENLVALMERIGRPVVFVVHSMGGVTGFELVRRRPDLVSSLVVVEPVGAPTDPDDVATYFAGTPYLAVYGDFIESRGQTGRWEACGEMARLITEAGGRGELVTLTDRGIQGNTHLMMQDKNNDVVAGVVMEWLASL